MADEKVKLNMTEHLKIIDLESSQIVKDSRISSTPKTKSGKDGRIDGK